MSDRLRLDLVLNDFVAGAHAFRKITLLSDGTPWRPLIHVRDMARAIDWALDRPAEQGGSFLALNTGSDEWNYQIRQLADTVAGDRPGRRGERARRRSSRRTLVQGRLRPLPRARARPPTAGRPGARRSRISRPAWSAWASPIPTSATRAGPAASARRPPRRRARRPRRSSGRSRPGAPWLSAGSARAPLRLTFADLGTSPLANSFLSRGAAATGEPSSRCTPTSASSASSSSSRSSRRPREIFSDYAYFSSSPTAGSSTRAPTWRR